MSTKTVYTVVEDIPDHTAHHTTHKRSTSKRFVRIGTATVNKDGSMSIHLSALPVSGELTVRDS